MRSHGWRVTRRVTRLARLGFRSTKHPISPTEHPIPPTRDRGRRTRRCFRRTKTRARPTGLSSRATGATASPNMGGDRPTRGERYRVRDSRLRADALAHRAEQRRASERETQKESAVSLRPVVDAEATNPLEVPRVARDHGRFMGDRVGGDGDVEIIDPFAAAFEVRFDGSEGSAHVVGPIHPRQRAEQNLEARG